jgi:acyl transferase domain-containing protein
MKAAADNAKPHLVRLAERLAKAQQEADTWAMIASVRGLSPAAAAWAAKTARSAATEVKIQEIGLALAKLHQARADHQTWSKVAAKPGLSPQAREFAMNAARSYAALVTLAQKALDHLTAPANVAHVQLTAPKAVPHAKREACEPLAKLIARRQASKARRAETVRGLIEQALSASKPA